MLFLHVAELNTTEHESGVTTDFSWRLRCDEWCQNPNGTRERQLSHAEVWLSG